MTKHFYKVFISQPMHGLSEKEIVKACYDALDEVCEYTKADWCIAIDNYTHENAPENAGRLWRLGRSIQQMAETDIVYFAKGWETAPGCRIEKAICEEYDLKHFTYEAYSDTQKKM